MYKNADVTIFNKYFDPVQGVERCQRTHIEGVYWDASYGASIRKTGMESENKVLILIPFEDNDESFCKPKEFDRLQAEERADHWTLKPGDKIVRGLIHHDGTMATLVQNYDDVYEITTVDTKVMGSPDMQHWEVMAK